MLVWRPGRRLRLKRTRHVVVASGESLSRCSDVRPQLTPYSATIPGKPTKRVTTRGITPYTNLPSRLAYSLGPCFRGWVVLVDSSVRALGASIFGCSVRIQQARAMSKTGFELSSADCPLWYGASFVCSYLLGVTSGIAALIDNCTYTDSPRTCSQDKPDRESI